MTATAEYEKAKQTPPTLPKAGDTVRVVIEGTTQRDWREVPGVGGAFRLIPGDKVTVEVIEEARTTFLDGDVIKVTRYPEFIAVRRSGKWSWTDSPIGNGPTDDKVAGYLAAGYYTPLRVGGKSSAAQS